ncbi:MAG TPA: hypothetical protein PLI09_11575 [Candidatus Hydrogenedentes bacterium]|mgnify:CR=1 FL=1|nr:hypothetical protein [Candidatus Hydrogenedentota bacterium]
MDLGISLQILWPVAAEEALAGGAEEIEPGHILCAALKVVEIDPSLFRDALPSPALLDRLKDELQALSETFNRKGIQIPEGTTGFRRDLRLFLRKENKGNLTNRSGIIHRSEKTKTAFTKAEDAARKHGERELGTAWVVDALFENPDEELAKALIQFGGVYLDVQSITPGEAEKWIDELGSDLTQRAREEKPDIARIAAVRHDAVCRVLAEKLFPGEQGKPRPALLVSRGTRTSAALVRDLSIWLISNEPPGGIRRGRVIEINADALLNRNGETSPEVRLEEIFRYAKEWKNMVLFFDNAHRYLAPKPANSAVPRRLRGLLKEHNVPCILGMTHQQYEAASDALSEWSGLLKPLWIHDMNPDFQL